jgi:hypothetical protein
VWARNQEKDWRPEDVLALQLGMNVQTWTSLQDHGVDGETEIRLDFAYEASDRAAAEELAHFLVVETDYEVHTDADRVTGSTQPTTVSLDMLDQWVEWMILAGHKNGRCKFDGWGAGIPF